MPRLSPLFLMLLLLGCRDFAVDSGSDALGKGFRSFDVQANIPFEIRVGDEAYLPVSDLTVTFSLVLEDTRCSGSGECEAPGRAGILLDLARGIGDETQIILQIPGNVPTPYRLNDYVQERQERFQLLSLDPVPSSDGIPSADPYTATVIIDR